MPLPRSLGVMITLLALSPAARADKHVVIIAEASPEYTRARLDENGKPRVERYVFMQGRFFEGMIRDPSIERMPFRELAASLAPELARQRYLPAPGPETADLLLVVHWGTTIPQIGLREMAANPTQELDHDRLLYEKIQSFSPGGDASAAVGGDVPGAFLDLSPEYRPKFGADNETAAGFSRLEEATQELGQQMRRSDNASLLGYNNELKRGSKRIWGTEDERAMRHDLDRERYFIIIRAYDLKKHLSAGSRKKPVWTMNLNISSPGNNFRTALTRMGEGVAHSAGQGDGSLVTIHAGKPAAGSVRLGDLIILGEAKQK